MLLLEQGNSVKDSEALQVRGGPKVGLAPSSRNRRPAERVYSESAEYVEALESWSGDTLSDEGDTQAVEGAGGVGAVVV